MKIILFLLLPMAAFAQIEVMPPDAVNGDTMQGVAFIIIDYVGTDQNGHKQEKPIIDPIYCYRVRKPSGIKMEGPIQASITRYFTTDWEAIPNDDIFLFKPHVKK